MALETAATIGGVIGLASLMVTSAANLYTFCAKIPKVAAEVEFVKQDLESLENALKLANSAVLRSAGYASQTPDLISRLDDEIDRCSGNLVQWQAAFKELETEKGNNVKNIIKKLKCAADQGRFIEIRGKLSSHRQQLGILLELFGFDIGTATLDLGRSSHSLLEALSHQQMIYNEKIAVKVNKLVENVGQIELYNLRQAETLEQVVMLLQKTPGRPRAKNRRTKVYQCKQINPRPILGAARESSVAVSSDTYPEQFIQRVVDTAIAIRARHQGIEFELFAEPNRDYENSSAQSRMKMAEYVLKLRLVLWILQRENILRSRIGLFGRPVVPLLVMEGSLFYTWVEYDFLQMLVKGPYLIKNPMWTSNKGNRWLISQRTLKHRDQRLAFLKGSWLESSTSEYFSSMVSRLSTRPLSASTVSELEHDLIEKLLDVYWTKIMADFAIRVRLREVISETP